MKIERSLPFYIDKRGNRITACKDVCSFKGTAYDSNNVNQAIVGYYNVNDDMIHLLCLDTEYFSFAELEDPCRSDEDASIKDLEEAVNDTLGSTKFVIDEVYEDCIPMFNALRAKWE